MELLSKSNMNFKMPGNKTIFAIKIGVFILALWPFIELALAAFNDRLGANPVEHITRSTGYWALVLLMVTLGVTPLRLLTGWAWLVRLRRMLGLYAFFYGCLHFLTYLVLDQYFDWAGIIEDIVKRPYITVGFPAFVLLIPLAITSNDRVIKWLGGKRWRLLHRLAYIITVGGVIHFWWLVKKDITRPLTFACVLFVLLVIRLFYKLQKRKRQIGHMAS